MGARSSLHEQIRRKGAFLARHHASNLGALQQQESSSLTCVTMHDCTFVRMYARTASSNAMGLFIVTRKRSCRRRTRQSLGTACDCPMPSTWRCRKSTATPPGMNKTRLLRYVSTRWFGRSPLPCPQGGHCLVKLRSFADE